MQSADTISAKRSRSIAVLTLLASVATAQAQSYPTRSVRIIVPFPPGGPVDSLARILAGKLNPLWNQQIVVDNRAGGNTVIGTELVARAQADGYTLLLNSTGIAINVSLYAKLPFDTARDLAPVATLAAGPGVLITHPALPVKTLKDLIALAKANPGKLVYASSGSGTVGHLTMEMLKKQAGIQLTHVPYRGVAPALVDLIAGQVPIASSNISAVTGHLKSGRLRGLAVSSLQRWPGLPDMPTISEAALPGYEAINWYGVFAPAATPVAIVEKINVDVSGIMQLPDVRNILNATAVSALKMTPKEFSAYFQAEIARWGKAVAASGARAD